MVGKNDAARQLMSWPLERPTLAGTNDVAGQLLSWSLKRPGNKFPRGPQRGFGEICPIVPEALR